MRDSKSTAFDDIYPHLRSDPVSPEYQAGWGRFWSQYEPRIRAWARQHQLDTNDADEVVGRVMAKLVQLMPTFEYDPTRGFSPWLRRVVHNVIVDLWASAAKQPGAQGPGGSSAVERLHDLAAEEPASDALELVVGTALNDFLSRLRADAEAVVKAQVLPTSWRAFEMIEKEKRSGKAASEETGLTVAAAFVTRGRVRSMIEVQIVRLGKAHSPENRA